MQSTTPPWIACSYQNKINIHALYMMDKYGILEVGDMVSSDECITQPGGPVCTKYIACSKKKYAIHTFLPPL